MKRSTGPSKLLYQLAAAGIVLASIVTAGVTALLAWYTYSDLTREIPPERSVPRINMNNLNKVSDILEKKESSVKIDLKTREVQFGREEPFD